MLATINNDVQTVQAVTLLQEESNGGAHTKHRLWPTCCSPLQFLTLSYKAKIKKRRIKLISSNILMVSFL